MRYCEDGQVHLDFHRTFNGTLTYLRERYGEAFVEQIARRMAQEVYRDIRSDLLRGDFDQLVEHWRHFMDRERGEYAIDRTADGATLMVTRCPAIAYLKSRGIPVDPLFCRVTQVLNEALAAGTPFEIATDIAGDGQCVQTLRRRS